MLQKWFKGEIMDTERPKYVGITAQNSVVGYLFEISEFLDTLERNARYAGKVKYNPLSFEDVSLNHREILDISDTCKFIAKQLS
jgi:hypothetical protein